MTEIIQGSAEWLAERSGKVTASRIADIIAKTKSGPSTSRANYMAQLVAERLTGTVAESYTNAAMHENLALYARIGFVETRRATEDGFDRVFMRWDLPGDD